jgi:glycosyltransferase involved in cell wall biosynthesis
MPSTTFIRSEIRAHEAAGVEIKRYAIRKWSGDLLDMEDRAEQARTTYLLENCPGEIVYMAFKEIFQNPLGMLRALGTVMWLALQLRGRHLYNFVYLLEAIRLKALVKDDGIHHLHAHFSTNSATLPLLARRLGGPSYSFTVHGPDELPVMKPNGISPKIYHASFVAAITDYAKGEILKATLGEMAEKVHVVRCGIDLSRFDLSPPEVAINHNLVCVGRLCPQKAQSELVMAVAKLRDKYPNLRLTLIGDGETRGEIEVLIGRYDLEGTVYLNGWATGEQVRAAIRASRALVLPSHAEGLPIVIMEAMALARPVVSTKVAGIPELLDAECGWIVPPGDVAALTAALDDCLSASAGTLTSLGAEGRSRVELLHNQIHNSAELRARFSSAIGGVTKNRTGLSQ